MNGEWKVIWSIALAATLPLWVYLVAELLDAWRF